MKKTEQKVTAPRVLTLAEVAVVAGGYRNVRNYLDTPPPSDT